MQSDWMSSYGYATAEVNGWGPRYFFTYYTALGHKSGSTVCIETIIYALVMACSLIANIAIIVAVLRKRDVQTVTNCFIVNLACADLLFVLGVPAIAAARASSSWHLGPAVCHLLPYSQFVCGSVLLWTLTAISVDRMYCLNASPYRSGLTHRTAVIACSVSWCAALIIYLPAAVFFKEQEVQYNTTTVDENSIETIISVNATICTLIFPASSTVNYSLLFTVPSVVISLLVPMTILVFNYHIIIRKLREIQRRLEDKFGSIDWPSSKLRESVQTIAETLFPGYVTPRPADIERNHTQLSRQPSNGALYRLKRHKRAIRILYLNVIAVLLMWIPIAVIMFLIFFDGHRSDRNYFLTSNDFIWCVIVSLVNTIVNPILYGFLTENYRNHFPFSDWFKSVCCKGRNNDTSTDKNFESSPPVTL